MTPTEAITTLALTANIMQAAAKQDATAAGAKYGAMRDYLTAIVERDADDVGSPDPTARDEAHQ